MAFAMSFIFSSPVGLAMIHLISQALYAIARTAAPIAQVNGLLCITESQGIRMNTACYRGRIGELRRECQRFWLCCAAVWPAGPASLRQLLRGLSGLLDGCPTDGYSRGTFSLIPAEFRPGDSHGTDPRPGRAR